MKAATRRWFVPGLGLLLVLLAAISAWVWFAGVHDNVDTAVAAPIDRSPAALARGAYLARVGNCALCHTSRGDAPFAGGRAFPTPFGTVYASNLTPDPGTGLGRWNAAEFWRALHHGRSRDGRLLVPVFPYTSTTRVTREDSDALFAYLQSLAAVAQANRPHALRWPYGTPWALATWRALFFRPGDGSVEAPASTTAEWKRGAYLVDGLGHCRECHAPRNALGATVAGAGLSGGLIPIQNWYAPSLLRRDEGSVADWDTAQITRLLKTGVAPRGVVTGPMAEVVFHSLQYLSDADLAAIAAYLKALPVAPDAPSPAAARVSDGLGAPLYDTHCANCHGKQGEGVPGAYPALAGNRAVQMAVPANLVQMVLHGGFAPATAGNPRPFGMPPFLVTLSDREIAAVLSHVRGAWGNRAAEVTELEVRAYRESERP